MQIDFEHPAIISGTAADGGPRNDLVRVASKFEIAEIDAKDAPVSFEFGMQKTSNPYVVRTVDGRHYQEYSYASGKDCLTTGKYLHTDLVGGEWGSFDPMWKTVKREAGQIASAVGREVNNLKRDITRRESNRGLSQEGKACLVVPLMKKQRWHSPDVETDVARWRDKAAEMLSNAVFIDGTLHIRCFEPCLFLAAQQGRAVASVSSRGVYQRQVHKKEYRQDGILVMGHNAGNTLSHYFSALEEERMADMAKGIGWKAKFSGTIDVKDEGFVSDDYFQMETVRSAISLYDFGRTYGFYAERYNEPTLGASFAAASEALKTGILEWQAGNCTAATVQAACDPLEELVMEAQRLEGRFAPSPEDFQRRIEHKRTREDLSDVAIEFSTPRLG